MKIEYITASTPCDPGVSALEAFAEKHGLVMQVFERSASISTPSQRFYARFEDTEVMWKGLLRGVYGEGPNPEAAINDYAARIVGSRIAVQAYTDKRREYDVPNDLSYERQV